MDVLLVLGTDKNCFGKGSSSEEEGMCIGKLFDKKQNFNTFQHRGFRSNPCSVAPFSFILIHCYFIMFPVNVF